MMFQRVKRAGGARVAASYLSLYAGLAIVIWSGWCAPAAAQGDARRGAAEAAHRHDPALPEIVEVTRIWDEAPHNAFTDLVRHEGRWYSTFREGERHVHGAPGVIRVLVSDDGSRWESAALLAEEGIDLRDPKVSVTPDGRLMLVMGGSLYRDGALVTCQPRVAFSEDGRRWTTPRPVLSEGEWLWRVTWHDGRAYGGSYNILDRDNWKLRLFTSRDGLDYELLSDLKIPGKPNETTLRFLPGGEAVALVRREAEDRIAWIGRSEAPYTDWTWRGAGYRIGGPNFVILPDGRMWAAGRHQEKTVLGRLDEDGFEPVLTLPSGGDTSYPGMVWHDGLLWMSYYSSHEGKAAIYLAKIRLP